MRQLGDGINAKVTWKEITLAGIVTDGGKSKDFETGDWRNSKPVWLAENCKQCLICTAFCPDSSIPVKDKKRVDFEYKHCKGCGICEKVCPFNAIEMKGEEE
ncbi:MAG: 4Fe-4S binding protein [Tissierellia bacterium]|nr:4Fe-4S binding protein [Tissierellia bacterium]MDD4725233.1 4Fe-4S binding protein [Tissierellia bacterium]